MAVSQATLAPSAMPSGHGFDLVLPVAARQPVGAHSSAARSIPAMLGSMLPPPPSSWPCSGLAATPEARWVALGGAAVALALVPLTPPGIPVAAASVACCCRRYARRGREASKIGTLRDSTVAGTCHRGGRLIPAQARGHVATRVDLEPSQGATGGTVPAHRHVGAWWLWSSSTAAAATWWTGASLPELPPRSSALVLGRGFLVVFLVAIAVTALLRLAT